MLWLFVIVFVVVYSNSAVLSANPVTEREKRESLATSLTNAMEIARNGTVNDPPVIATIPEGLTFRSYTGECHELVEVAFKLVDEASELVRLTVTLRGEADMDIPAYSHRLVCDLNYFLGHTFFGNYRQNWNVDEEGEIVFIDDANMEANCASNATQKFWMIDGNQTYSGSGLKLLNAIAGYWWKPTEAYSGRLVRIRDDSQGCILIPAYELAGTIPGWSFMASGNPDKVWIARREQADPDRIVLHRAHVKLNFNYAYYDGIPSCDEYAYVDAFNDAMINVNSDPNFIPYSKRLATLEMIARMQEYPSNQCPQGGSASITSHPDHAELVFNITYTDIGGNPTTVTCTQVFDQHGTDVDANNQDLWNRMQWYQGRLWGEFGIDPNGVVYFETTTQCSGSTTEPVRMGLIKVRNRAVPPDYCELILTAGGEFCVDDITGEILYMNAGATTCTAQSPLAERIFCFSFCETISGFNTYDNVLGASAQTFRGKWQYDPADHGTWNNGNNYGYSQPENEAYDPYKGLPNNAFERGERGKWRPDNAYIFRSDIKSGIGNNRVYDNAGIFVDESGNPSDAFTLFDWRDPADNVSNWLNPVTITRYAPSGESVEEHNIIGIYGSAALAHDATVPRLVAQNATNNSVDFESFEDRTWWNDWDSDGDKEWHPELVTGVAHSGERSMLLDVAGNSSSPLASSTLTSQILANGLLLKFWLKQEYKVYDANPSFSDSPVEITVGPRTFSNVPPANYNTLDADLIHKVAQTGEWSLYQLIVRNFGSASENDELVVSMKNKLGPVSGDNVWVDDIRLQPLDAAMTCFVYDRHTLRLVAQFDDQHFGIFSRYNGEGNLVSVLRETERGKVTVSESQAWVKTQLRSVGSAAGSSISSGPIVPSSFQELRADPFRADVASGMDQSSDFDILSMRIGPQGPSVQLLNGTTMPLSDLGKLLDFKADFPEVDTDYLATLAPDVSDLERLHLIRELIELDQRRKNVVRQLESADSDRAKEEANARLETIDKRRGELLHEKLGLSDEDIEALYRELGTSENGSENNEGE